MTDIPPESQGNLTQKPVASYACLMESLPLEDIARIARSHGALRVSVFGSHARGTARADSDLDLLVGMRDGATLFDLGRMQLELEALLGIPVEVVTERGLRPEFRDQVMREARVIAA